MNAGKSDLSILGGSWQRFAFKRYNVRLNLLDMINLLIENERILD